jgi:hypothetical protein
MLLHAQYICNPIANVLLLIDFFHIPKMSCCQGCCSCYYNMGAKITALVVEHFGMCCSLCSLHRILEMYLRASAEQVVAVVLPIVLQSDQL